MANGPPPLRFGLNCWIVCLLSFGVQLPTMSLKQTTTVPTGAPTTTATTHILTCASEHMSVVYIRLRARSLGLVVEILAPQTCASVSVHARPSILWQVQGTYICSHYCLGLVSSDMAQMERHDIKDVTSLVDKHCKRLSDTWKGLNRRR